MNAPLLKLISISKSFGGIKALQDVSLELEKGQVLSVVGENGAGKSTLMKIIAGAITPDSGAIYIDGEKTSYQSPMDAIQRGISIVFQEPNIFPDLSVLENIFSGNEFTNGFGTIDWKKMQEMGTEVLKSVGLPESILGRSISELSIGTQQLVLIARGIFQDCKVLILDEPTSILSHNESEKLFSIIDNLKMKGISIIYISHRIPEILRISNHIIVLRDGKITDSVEPYGVDESKIIAAMSGRLIETNVFIPRTHAGNDAILSVKGLSCGKEYEQISFDVQPGEILGLYGLVGAGRSEIVRTIFGEKRASQGTILFKGEDITTRSIPEIVRLHIHYVPEDRGGQGLFFDHSITRNMSVSFLDRISNRLGFIRKQEERRIIQENIDRYSIKTVSQDIPINALSGGSQQKVLFCRWLLVDPEVLILDEPTRGIDIVTKTEIHRFIMDLATKNVAIILISSDLKEILELSDRIITLRKGRITGRFVRDDFTEEKILASALGL